MWQALYNAIFAEDQKLSVSREIARHLAKVALYELKGIEALHPQIRPLADQLLKFPNIAITETFRTAALQDKYYSQGRTSPGSTITNAKALQSYHQFGLAFDIKFTDGIPYPSLYDKWKVVGEAGEKIGLIWGGRFNDLPHFEYHPGFVWNDLVDIFKQ